MRRSRLVLGTTPPSNGTHARGGLAPERGPGTTGVAGAAAFVGLSAMADQSGSSRVREALSYCARREHLRRTVRIALVVGVILTIINQLDVLLSGAATTVTVLKCGLNFIVPFVVSNLGLLSGRDPSGASN